MGRITRTEDNADEFESQAFEMTENKHTAGNIWGVGGEQVIKALRSLTKTERRFVEDGCIHGDFRMSTVRNLERKAMFFLRIDSPNGRCGTMVLTPLGENVRATIKARATQPGEV